MSVKLLVKQRNQAGDPGQEVVLDLPVITLGRDKSCQVVLTEQAVSRAHAKISQDGPLFFVEDLGSAFGTQINGKKLPKGEKRLLRNGDVIAIAQFDVTFERLTELPKSDEKTSFVARQVVKDVMKGLASSEGPFFRIMSGPREGERIEITEAQEIVVGRDPTADVIFDDDLMSRRHAKIRRDWSGTHLEDLKSRNGVKVNKKKVTGMKTLRDRDEVTIGGTRLLYLDPSEVREPTSEPEELGEMTEPPKPEPEQEKPADAEPAAASESKPEAAAGEVSSGGALAALASAEAPAPSAEASAVAPVPEPEPEPAPPSEDAAALAAAAAKRKLIAAAAMGVFALLAIVVIIAVIVGA